LNKSSLDSNKSPPIADLFVATTIMFADIAGFTAWSSARAPVQVFTLLETLYDAFDKCAKDRGVFKVETIGDCYVAVTGLPEPRVDHAAAMARFARDCLIQTRKLEATLGPDTADLHMRIGIFIYNMIVYVRARECACMGFGKLYYVS
jgi:class 3 adenylate cyclase